MYLELDYGTFEIFHADEETVAQWNEGDDVSLALTVNYAPGWYYWACHAGCMPDGEPIGAFPNEDLAIEDCEQENTNWS